MKHFKLLQTARSEGDAARAEERLGKPRVNFPEKHLRRSVNFGTDAGDNSRLAVTRGDFANASAAEVSLLGAGELSVSAPSYLSALESSFIEAEALYAGQPRFAPGRFDSQRWDNLFPESSPPICYKCYATGHPSTNCDLKLRNLYHVPGNHLKLTDVQRKRVPNTSFLRAVAALRLPVAESL